MMTIFLNKKLEYLIGFLDRIHEIKNFQGNHGHMIIKQITQFSLMLTLYDVLKGIIHNDRLKNNVLNY